MKLFIIVLIASFANPSIALAQYPFVNPSQVVNPIQVIHNSEMNKEVNNLINTHDIRFRFDRYQGEHYTILKSKTCEIWFENWESVEKYIYTLSKSVNIVKSELGKFGVHFEHGNSTYVGNGKSASACYAIKVQSVSPSTTKITYSYKCN